MHPVVDPRLACSCLALCDLIGMMDRDGIDSTAVDIELLSQIVHAHGRALDVPARISASPGGIPHHGLFAELAVGEPEHEVLGIAFVGVDIDSGAALEVVEIQLCKSAVLREGVDGEIDVSACHIGVAAGLEALDQIDHLLDVLCGGTDDIGPDDVQAVVVLEEGIGVELGDIPDAAARFTGALGHLVFALIPVSGEVSDIGYVHYMLDFIAGMAKHTLERVLEDVCPEVADVGVVVDSRAAAVESDETFSDGFELLDGPGHGIVKIDLHVLSDYGKNISNNINLVNIIRLCLNQSGWHATGAPSTTESEEQQWLF